MMIQSGKARWAIGAAILMLGLSAGAAGAEQFKAGVIKTDITPTSEMYLAGYGHFRQAAPDPQVTKLYARALAIQDSAGTKVIVSADVLGFTQALHNQIVAESGVPYANLILAASHTHSGPVLKDNLFPSLSYGLNAAQLTNVDAYTLLFKSKVVQAIRDAMNALTPVTLSYGSAVMGPGYVQYRTNAYSGNETNLPQIPVLVLRKADATILATVFGFTSHAIKMGQNFWHYDFPGVTQKNLENAYANSVALFLQGCAGDLNPVQDPDPMGGALSEKIKALITGGMTAVTGSIQTSYANLPLPLDVYQKAANGNVDPPGSHAVLRTFYAQILDATKGSQDKIWYKHAVEMLRRIDANQLQDNENEPVQVWIFGGASPMVLVALGGEPVSGYAIALKSKYQGKVGNDPNPRGTPENRPMGDTSKPANGIRQDKVVITHNGPWRQ